MATEAPRRRLNRPLAIAAIVVALIIGLLLGTALGAGKRLFGGPDAETIATSALQSMRAQNRLVPFVARFVSVVSSREERLGGLLESERTLVLPGTVRYELDLSKLEPDDLNWDPATSTLRVVLPEIELAGPEVDLKAAREYGEDGLLGGLTDASTRLDRANRDRAVADLRAQAGAATPMRLARDAARSAIEHSFQLPLAAAGIDDAKVIARFASDASPVTEPLDRSRSYNEVLDEARARR